MEINTQQMEALLQLQEQQAQLPRKNISPATGFDSLLKQQMAGLEQTGTQPSALENANLYSHMLLNDTKVESSLDADAAFLQAAFDEASGALDMWDQYAQTLGASTETTALRDAYSLLQGIDIKVSQLRASQTPGKSPELDAILNDLEVLSATEKFKFNRGDYIS